MNKIEIKLDDGKIEIYAKISSFVWDALLIIMEEAALGGLITDVSVKKNGKKIGVENLKGGFKDSEESESQSFSV